MKSNTKQEKGQSCPILDVSGCETVRSVIIEVTVGGLRVLVNCVVLLCCVMSDADSQLQTPRSPLEGDDSVSLTEEQIQHVWIVFPF